MPPARPARPARQRSLLVGFLVALLGIGTWLISDHASDGGSTPQAAAPTVSSTVSTSPSASGSTDPDSGLPWVAPADLPAEARHVLTLIDQGGPFPYPDKDGSTFGNVEGLLPPEPRGYYAEYTVPTPGESDRGARRIIAGDGGELYWTADHYASFSRIRA